MLLPKPDNCVLIGLYAYYIIFKQNQLEQLYSKYSLNTAMCVYHPGEQQTFLCCDSGTWLVALPYLGSCPFVSKDRSPQVQDSRNQKQHGEGPFKPMRPHCKLQCLRQTLVSRKGPILPNNNASLHITKPMLQKLNQWAMQFCLIHHVHLTSYHRTMASSNIPQHSLSTASRMPKVLPRTLSNQIGRAHV